VICDTEQILVPNRGARLGNTVAEWMQTKRPEYWDCCVCEKYGSVFAARIRYGR